jgi:hypothetical protein
MKDKQQAQVAGLAQTRDTLVQLRTALKNKVNNILSAHGIGLRMQPGVPVTERENTARRILLSFVRYGFPTQPAFSVRGSSRRILTMRFRPADIRLQ